MYHNLVRFFMCATHYMRNPMKPPVDDLVSALLILIHSLNCLENKEDLEVFAHAVSILANSLLMVFSCLE